MLNLNQYNNRLMNNASNDLLRYDYHFFNTSRLTNIGLPRSKFLEHACLPFLMNGIELKQRTYMFDSQYTDPEFFATIITDLHDRAIKDTTDYSILRCYVAQSDMETFCGALNNEAYTEVPAAVKTLYNTCVKQTELREGATFEYVIRVFKSKINHTLVLVLNFDDYNQASDVFLTIGLTPILFEDYKEKFCEEEMNYFSTLVKRSQIKRISNVAASDAFNKMCSCNKYTEILRTETTKIIINNIIRTKTEACQRELERAEDNARQILSRYDDLLKQYYKLQQNLQQLIANQDTELEEIKTAISIPAVYKLDQDRHTQYGIEITLQTPCAFYELDEVECVMNNINPDTVFYKFVQDVFIDQKYKLYLGHTFRFSFNTNDDFDPNNIISWDELKEMNCMCNPHLFRFSCLGDYKPKMIEAMRKQDLTMFINFGIASLKSINFRDGAVINHWKSLFNDMESNWNNGSGLYRIIATSKCLEDVNGNRLSIADVYLTPEETVEAPAIDVEEV